MYIILDKERKLNYIYIKKKVNSLIPMKKKM